MDSRLQEYLRQLKVSAQNSVGFLSNMTYDEFQADTKTQHAVSMGLINIGEAVVRISERFPDFVTAHPHLPWSEIRGMRNSIAHNYWFLNFETIWQTAHEELPRLLKSLEKIEKE